MIRKEKGITLIALVVTIVVLLILAGVSISMLTGENGIITQAQDAKEKTDIGREKEIVQLAAVGAASRSNYGKITEDNLEKELNSMIGERDRDYTLTEEDGRFIVTYLDSNRSYEIDENGNVTEVKEPEDEPEVSAEPEFSRAYGVIEIEFLSGTSYSTTTIPNEPNMTNDMKAVYWENGVEKVEGESADFDKSKWYSYIAQTGDTTSGGTSKWANAKTSDGSYWVWIPRYAYRIVYFDTQEHRDAYKADNTQTTGIIGYSDARGIVNEKGETPSDIGEPVTSIGVGENLLRPHPAFENGSSTGFTQGEWNSRLKGIWIAKYETSQNGATVKSTPGVSTYRYLKMEDMYTKAYEYDREKESHMLKNSEWGAMAYLTESKYGRNGTPVTPNKDNNYNTGGISGATALTNPLQSTTGNEYGIYDTVGGSFEYVTGYIADSGQSTEYATAYNMSSSNTNTENYKENINKKFGDGIVEISTSGIGSNAWHGTESYFIGIINGQTLSVFGRGGLFNFTNPGLFYFAGGDGESDNDNTFRMCLAIK